MATRPLAIDEKIPRVDENYRHESSGWRFRSYQSSMLRYAAADNLADRAGVHPNPDVMFESRLEIYAPSTSSGRCEKHELRVMNIRTLDVLGGTRMSWRGKKGGCAAIGTTLAIDSNQTKNKNDSKRCALFQHLPHTLRRNDVFCGNTQENEWNSFDYELPSNIKDIVIPKSQYSSRWNSSRARFNADSTNCRPLETDSDWTYTVSAIPRVTLHDETKDEECDSGEGRSGIIPGTTTYKRSCLPIDLLSDQSIPILFYSSLTYFEDELEDSGMSRYQLKIRVQDNFFFLLARNDVRVDNVLVRRCDTRCFGNIGKEPITLPRTDDSGPTKLLPGSILREWSHEEVSFERLRERGDLRTKSQIKDASTMFRHEDLRFFVGTVFAS